MNFKYKDPDVRAICTLCRGPIFIDEPEGQNCIDCRLAMLQISEAHNWRGPGQLNVAERVKKLNITR